MRAASEPDWGSVSAKGAQCLPVAAGSQIFLFLLFGPRHKDRHASKGCMGVNDGGQGGGMARKAVP